jgi:DNA-binding CsgD family transcriptional regulator/tetratricopeptide (TPR) repeat protein
MEPWPLTGRAEELGTIADVLSGDGEYAGAVIAGPPGVGKTRLAREAASAAAEQGCTVNWVTGTAAAQSIPLAAFEQWTDGLETNPLHLVRGVITTITGSSDNAQVLVAVDDAHLLDDLSAFVLHQLVLRGAAKVIATLRGGEPAPDAVTALWKDAHLRRLDLQPLSRPQSDALLESALGGQVSTHSAERMWQLTRGNVLFLHQLVNQELAAGRLISSNDRWQWVGTMVASPSLIDLVDLHIGAAPAPVLDVIDLVAVAEPLELAYLAALANPQAIEESERRGLIALSRMGQTDVARLGHPLYGEVRRAQSSRLRLARLRGRIAQLMTTARPDLSPPDPLRLGLLWLHSDLPPDPEVFLRAAQAGLIRLDLALAQRFSEAAVVAGAGVDAELLCAFTLLFQSRGEEAEELLAPLTARQLPDTAWSTAVYLRAGNLLWPLGRREESWKVINEALATASGTVTDGLSGFRAVLLATAARPAEALATAESIDRGVLAAVPALMLAWARTIALGDLGLPGQATAVADDGAALAAASPEAAYELVILVTYHVQALVLGGCLSQALTVAERTHNLCTDVPGIARTMATGTKGAVALATGELNTAVECLRSAITDFDLANTTYGGGSYHFAIYYTEALARAGDVEAALDALSRMQRDRHPAHAYRESDNLLAAAWVAAARARTSEARTLATRAAEHARAHGQHAREVVCLQAAIQFGDHQHAGRLTELASLVEGPRAALTARWASALAADNGDALLEVSADLETMGDRIAAADAAAHASLAFHRRDQRGSALTASTRASRIITQCGATSPSTGAAASPLPLTDREREIAVLVGQGLSNREIAKSLTVSIRTVENHIYRACSHLGIATRDELGRLVSQSAASETQP